MTKILYRAQQFSKNLSNELVDIAWITWNLISLVLVWSENILNDAMRWDKNLLTKGGNHWMEIRTKLFKFSIKKLKISISKINLSNLKGENHYIKNN